MASSTRCPVRFKSSERRSDDVRLHSPGQKSSGKKSNDAADGCQDRRDATDASWDEERQDADRKVDQRSETGFPPAEQNARLAAVDEVAPVQDTDPGDQVHEIEILFRLDIEEDQDSRDEPEDEREEAEQPLLADHRRAEGALLSKPCESDVDPGVLVI